MIVAIRIDEDLEIVVVEDDGVLFGECSPYVRLFQQGAHVKKFIVPQQASTSTEEWRRSVRPPDVDKRIGPRRVLP